MMRFPVNTYNLVILWVMELREEAEHMMISTKGRYALRVMVDLAEHMSCSYTPLKEIARRQEISEKYLESILKVLVKNGLLVGLRGKGGGYKLTRAPEDYTLGELLRAAEGSLAPVSCLDCTNEEICPQVGTCPTVGVWRDLGRVTAGYLDSKTLADLVRDPASGDDAPCAARPM